ncbi:ubiquinol-cytochrome C reductase [Russula compacta]|nr:ubiquinol-cytochrome C reductase [Russula compacta]
MALSTAFYNTFVKRNSVYVTSIFAGAFAFGIGFDVAVSNFWDSRNRGVCPSHNIPPSLLSLLFNGSLTVPPRSVQKQWKDIRHKYVQEADSE